MRPEALSWVTNVCYPTDAGNKRLFRDCFSPASKEVGRAVDEGSRSHETMFFSGLRVTKALLPNCLGNKGFVTHISWVTTACYPAQGGGSHEPPVFLQG